MNTAPSTIPNGLRLRRIRDIRVAVLVACLVTVVTACASAPATNDRTPATATPTASVAPASPTPIATPDPVPTDSVVPDPQVTAAGPATVTIVSSGADGRYVYASGLVTGDAGTGGVCTLTATSADGQALVAQREAQPTPAAVNCGVVEVLAPKGEWTLVLSYRSDTASASSAPTMVDQP